MTQAWLSMSASRRFVLSYFYDFFFFPYKFVYYDQAEDILNRKSGWKAITGTTDFGVITSKAELDDPDPDICSRNPYRLAVDLFVDRILHYVGSYHLKLNGEVDAIVFAGGIGEKGVQLRSMIVEKL